MEKVKNFFWNTDESRLRAGWRIIAFMVIFTAIVIPAQIGIRAAFGSLSSKGILIWIIVGSSATLAAYISRKYIDKRDMVSFGLKFDKAAMLDVLSGIVNSALVMTGVFFTMLWAGLVEFNGFTWWMDSVETDIGFQTASLHAALRVFFIFIIVGWWEELAFRGVILQNMMEGMNLLWATIISSLIFGFVHYTNDNATVLSSLLIAIITIQLIYAYVKTGQLWLPIGIHIGWNFFQASVFGFASSGNITPSMISVTPAGPELLSGGAFGPEASLLIVPFTGISLMLIHWWVRMSRVPEQKFMEFIIK